MQCKLHQVAVNSDDGGVPTGHFRSEFAPAWPGAVYLLANRCKHHQNMLPSDVSAPSSLKVPFLLQRSTAAALSSLTLSQFIYPLHSMSKVVFGTPQIVSVDPQHY